MKQHHIIIICESERLRDVMQSALAGESYRVSGVSPSFADVRALAALRPDVLIVDWLLGCEDHGLQVLQMLQLCKPLSALPVIVCSAPIALVREIERWLRGSNVQFLLKPFGLAELHCALQTALGLTVPEVEVEVAAQVAPAVGQAPGERDGAEWQPAQPRVLTARRSAWEREWHTADAGPAEPPLADETAAVGG